MTREEMLERLRNLYEYDPGAIDMAIEALESQRWISVSDRLPDKEGYYLVYFNSPYLYKKIYVDYYTLNDDEDLCGWDTFDYEIKAWMPLPEPWKGETQ